MKALPRRVTGGPLAQRCSAGETVQRTEANSNVRPITAILPPVDNSKYTDEKGQTRRKSGTQSYGSLGDHRAAERDMKMTSSPPDKDNPHDDVTSSADKATTRSKNGAPGKREHHSPSPVEDAKDGVMKDAER